MRTKHLLPLLLLTNFSIPAAVIVSTSDSATQRERFAAESVRKVTAALKSTGEDIRIVVGAPAQGLATWTAQTREAFHLLRRGNTVLVAGSDPSGVLYGSLELATRIRAAGKIPLSLDVSDHPVFLLRGPCIGMQKPEITYDGAMYDYRYTPQEFPFFYDKKAWTRYLDFLLENRMNTLYLWNGHPFTSLLRLPKYPEAQELSDEQLASNIEMFHWLATEADKRGIWVIQSFYNIHISHVLGRARGLPFHQTTPSEFSSEYTRYCLSEFIKNYPNVGIMMTLGEALGPQYGPEWLSKTIIPGVKGGMRAVGITQEPPIIVRAHATKIELAMQQALPLYKNIYTMHKWTGESLTWTDVRGEVLRLHKRLVDLGSTHIVNVHLLSNLEPFRWGSPEYIQQVMQSSQRIGIKGLHLYPLRYWDWPISADNPAELQIDRDWIWFEAWARYAWNPNRSATDERMYWTKRIAGKYGNDKAAGKILDAYQNSGVCAPRLLPRIGITEGNRQSLTLGMLMPQLIDPDLYNPATTLWTADAPPGERLIDYVDREWEGKPHEGETPIGVTEQVVLSAQRAVKDTDEARPYVTSNKDEFERLANDMKCILAEMQYYRAKTMAAAQVLRYGHSKDLNDLRQALSLLEESLAHYETLVNLTDKTYRQACSVHSISRRIPFLGGPGRYTHWRDCVPAYRKELDNFRRNLTFLTTSGHETMRNQERFKPFPSVSVKLKGGNGDTFTVSAGAKLYTDGETRIEEVAPELKGLTGIRISQKQAQTEGVRLQFELPEPAQILVGFFRSSKKNAAAIPPKDEWGPVLRNAIATSNSAGFSAWSHALPAGNNDLDFGKGAYVVLGFIKKDTQPEPRMVFFANSPGNQRPELNWLFE